MYPESPEQVQLLVVTRTENSRVVSVYKVKRSNKPNCSSHKTHKTVIENNKNSVIKREIFVLLTKLCLYCYPFLTIIMMISEEIGPDHNFLKE